MTHPVGLVPANALGVTDRSLARSRLELSRFAAAAGAHNLHAGHSVAMFRDKFWLSLALTIPVVFWSTDIQHWLGYTAPTFPGSKFIPPILGTVVFVYGGLVFIRGARRELAELKPGMMTLISLGIIAAFGTSLAGTFGLFDIDVWWELTSLITISDPRDVVGAIELSRATYRKMIQNLVWATAYNLIAIPAAAGLFVRWGVELPHECRCSRDELVHYHRSRERSIASPAQVAT